jgi:pimeloyl-ACP methyl ester carboxylesterase
MQHYLPGLWRLVPASDLRRGIDDAGRLAGFDPDQASPQRLIRRTRARVLILHGTDDVLIPQWHSELIQAAAPSRVERLLVPGRGHDDVLGDAEANRRVIPWLKSALQQ